MKLNKAQRDILNASVTTWNDFQVNKPITVAYNISEVRNTNYSASYKKYCNDMQELEEAGLIVRETSSRPVCFAYMNINKLAEIAVLMN